MSFALVNLLYTLGLLLDMLFMPSPFCARPHGEYETREA